MAGLEDPMSSAGVGAVGPPLAALGSMRKVLCLGAHPDDIEIGCGATVRRLAAAGADVRWLVLTGDVVRAAETHRSAELLLGSDAAVTVHDFRDGFLPYETPGAVKDAVRAHHSGFDPDTVFAPSLHDAHQDHRFLGELTWQIYRRQLVLEYEIPKYEGDLGSVNTYVPISRSEADRKIADLRTAYPSQHAKPWFDDELFHAMLRIRGMESGADSGLAEAFVARKMVLV